MNVARFFLSETMDRQRLPVALLSGFLGSGKTTLVNALLSDPRMRDTAVAINEFGAVPIDHELIDAGADRTVVLANGCLCCTVADDFEGAVMRIFGRRTAGALPRFARMIVEPSGLADPAPLAHAIMRNPSMSRVLRLDGIYTVVDALFGTRHLEEHEQCVKQVALATRIVLSKTDLALDIAALRAQMVAVNPIAPIIEAQHGRLDPAALFSPHFLDPTVSATAEPDLPLGVATVPHQAPVRATVLTAEAPLPWAALDRWLRGKRVGMADNLLRLKGIANIQRSDRPIVLQGIHHVLHPPVALDRWSGEDRRTRLVLITRGLDENDVREGWEELGR